jgi:hypothetical protein
LTAAGELVPLAVKQPVPEPSVSSALLRKIKTAVKADRWFTYPENTRCLSYVDGLFYKHGLLVVPNDAALRKQVIAQHHGPPYSGHWGVRKTAESLLRFYWWPGLAKEVKQFVQVCDACQRNKSSTTKPSGLLQPLPIPEGKWESIGMDFIVGLPCTAKGFDSILVIIDRLSKMVHLVPTMATATAADVAQLFVDHVVKLHGFPQSIVSDRDSKFTSTFWTTVCELWGLKRAMSTAFHPATDGQTERVNRMLEEYLRCYVSPLQDDWDRFLPMAEFAINDSYQVSIGMTPFYMTYGYHPHLPNRLGEPGKDNPAGKLFVENIQKAVKRAKEVWAAAQQRQKMHADSKRKDVQFAPGDMVLLSTANIILRTPGTQKLLPRFIGPFKVLKQVGTVAYKLKLPDAMKVHPVFHVSLLKAYRADGPIQPPPLPLTFEDGLPLYEVERVLKHRDKNSQGQKLRVRQYLIKWKGYGVENNTWEPETNLNAAALNSYLQSAAGKRVRS